MYSVNNLISCYTALFCSCVKKELQIDNQNQDNFGFSQKGITPRVLIGLKEGNLLRKHLTEQEKLNLNIRTPWLFPNLTTWRTPVNAKLHIFGSHRIDPLLGEEKTHYPRFKLLVKGGTTEEEILQEIKREVTDLKKILSKKFNNHTRRRGNTQFSYHGKENHSETS